MSKRKTEPVGSTSGPAQISATPSEQSPFIRTSDQDGQNLYDALKGKIFVGNTPIVERLRDEIVRRHKEDQRWRAVCISQGGARCFTIDFNTGALFGVRFEHEAPPMYCLPAYNSTGEAHGVMYKFESAPTLDETLFEEIVSVAYDPERRYFFTKGNPDRRLTSADVLVLHGNGSATAYRLKQEVISQ